MRPGTFFEKQTNLNLLRQFEIMQQTYQVRQLSTLWSSWWRCCLGHSKNFSDDDDDDDVPETGCYVIDGGSLLHRFPWKTGDSYGAIAESYADFNVRHYGQATVVFDGYSEGHSIKDNTHQRRGKNMHPIVSFTAETEFSGKKEDFCLVTKTRMT